MADFDPYQTWLGVPAEEQPANLYRLLGLTAEEADYVRVTTSADQRMAQLKSVQKGSTGGPAIAIMAELQLARATLSDTRRRAIYDALLKDVRPAVTCDVQTLPGEQSRIETNGADSLIGGRIDKYKVWERYSASPRGVLFKVQHVDTQRRSFLKQLPHEADGDRELQKSFQREIEILTRANHPNLVCGRGSGFCDGLSYVVYDFVLGVDLFRLVESQGKQSPDDAVRFIAHAARGLEQLHKQNVSHRNLRPHTLVADVQGSVRVTNPLLAKVGEPISLAPLPEMVKAHTPATSVFEYLPPEQFEDCRKADHRSDMYALGCVLCYLLIGRPPYPGKTAAQQIAAHKNAPLPSLRAIRNDVPIALDNVFVKMVAKQPGLRYNSMKEMLEDLESSTKRGTAKIPPRDNLWVQWMKRLGIRK